ncbi:molybdopterin dinucleotide binding domain-containing protein [Thermosulfurimonas sp. F29]|uniref:molybdopterin dinucleotide binding domain-containing protein n=1 Tax=Thermosulfurimonas sp. F29 TaxID=2867247 RepID=UPI001C83F27B|nr:molybdopterin dinucleotide binding domain-containing protein [Thermosulfurimonas sp. F29]MBX6422602.1 molybdopterin-dependent oxidoreductase [Thermosulfurimonas sp. F29]
MPARRDFLKMMGMLGVMVGFPGVAEGFRRAGGEFAARRCIGCQACVVACAETRGLPADRFLHRIVFAERGHFPEVKGGFRREVTGCDLCAGRAEGPVCVRVCPTGALRIPGAVKTRPLPGERVVHTVCLACNARCGLRVRVRGERPVFFEGNPYHPYNRAGEPLPYDTPVAESLAQSAATCGKPQCDGDYLENPYRVLVPLKRNGPRGSGRFVPIPWSQLIREIAEGGKLFAHLGDERHYPGLREILSDEPLDPSAPELSPKRNQLVWITGRSQAGRKHFINRFVSQAVGSINHIGHTDICGLGFRMGNFILTDGTEVELKADFKRARYIIAFGANFFAAGQPGPSTAGAIMARRVAAGDLRVVVVDPRGHEGLSIAHEWLPVRPGEDGALAMGMLRVMLEEGLYDREFLERPSERAARKAGRNLYTNATHLVVVEEGHALYGRILRVGDLALPGPAEEPVVVDPETERPVPASKVLRAKLLWEGRLGLSDGSSVRVKTAFSLFREAVFEHALDFYAERAGVPVEKIRKVAREFAAAAPYAAAYAYHGGGNYPGGAYASFAIALLNLLVGNVNRRGGYLPAGGGAADWQRGPYDLRHFPGALRPRGVKISREKASYENTAEFRRRGYPARLPWFPFTRGGLSVSALEGIAAGYPYPVKILFTYFFNPLYSIPGGTRFAEALSDPERVPLHVSVDVTVNETNVYADYIVPDVTYLEGHYGFLTPHAPGERFTAVRTPVVEPRTGRTPDGRPFSLETFLVDLAEHLGLPGFGKNAIPGRDGRLHPLHRAEDFYLRGIANLAENAGVPEAPEEERRFVEENYPVARYRKILEPGQWRRCCTVLARGGVFLREERAFDSRGNLRSRLEGRCLCLWNERLAASGDGLSPRRFHGTLRYPYRRSKDRGEFPFFLITHKMALHTQSRTICYERALALSPDPPLLMNPGDASALGLREGDRVRVVSGARPEAVVARVSLSERVRPGCVVLPHHYGHWQHGAGRLLVPGAERVFLGGRRVSRGEEVIADPQRAAGVSPNLLYGVRVDPLGGIPDFSGERVRVEKLS